MKKKELVYITIIILASLLLTACSNETTGTVLSPHEEPEEAISQEEPEAEAEDLGKETGSETHAADIQEDTDTTEKTSQDQVSNKPAIVWIGDSLTQGSLGKDNNNENNPQAPWRVHGDISGLFVAGAGFYGFHTDDIFKAYEMYNGIMDPDVVYVYWVGSNDCFDSPDNVKSVIEETDRFNDKAGITRFIMLGTTNRTDMPDSSCEIFNKALSEHYGDRYLDIIPYVEFGPDGVHLTEESYAAVAAAAHEKLKAMDYINP